MRLSASVKTFVKYALWTAVAAVIDYALANLGLLDLPTWGVAALAGLLKSAATYVATQRD